MKSAIDNRTAGRPFCALRRLKTYLRSTMKEGRLNGLVIMNIYVSLNAEDFAGCGSRKMELLF